MFYDENLLKHSRFPPENFNDGCFLSDYNNTTSTVWIKIRLCNNSLHFFRIHCWLKIQHWRSSFPSMRVWSLASYAWRSPSRRNETLPNLSRHKETKGVEGSVTRLGQLLGQIIERLSFHMDNMYLTSFSRILTFITCIFVALHKISSFIMSYLHLLLQEICNKWIPDYFTLKTFVLDIYAMVWNKLLVKYDTR